MDHFYYEWYTTSHNPIERDGWGWWMDKGSLFLQRRHLGLILTNYHKRHHDAQDTIRKNRHQVSKALLTLFQCLLVRTWRSSWMSTRSAARWTLHLQQWSCGVIGLLLKTLYIFHHFFLFKLFGTERTKDNFFISKHVTGFHCFRSRAQHKRLLLRMILARLPRRCFDIYCCRMLQGEIAPSSSRRDSGAEERPLTFICNNEQTTVNGGNKSNMSLYNVIYMFEDLERELRTIQWKSSRKQLG